MAIPASGAVSIGDLATEFGGSAPHSLSEYYRGGGLVPSTKQDTVTASSTSSSTSGTTNRGYPTTQGPEFNTGNNIANAQLWADNGSTGNFTLTCDVNVTGTYNIPCSSFLSTGDPGLSASFTLKVNGSTVNTASHTQSGSDAENQTTTFTRTISSGDTVQMVCQWSSRGWAKGGMKLNGDSGQRYITTNTNTGVPTSGTLTLQDFYGSSA